MLDLNNPYLGKQEIADMLRLETSPEFKEERRKMYKAGYQYSSPSYWKMSAEEFKELLYASHKYDLNTFFQYTCELKELHPDSDILLMEHDRVEAGEYDNFYCEFMPIGYQNVLAVSVSGKLLGELPKHPEEAGSDDFQNGNGINVPAGKEEIEEYNKYSLSAYMLRERKVFAPIGIYDIALPALNDKEDKRVNKRTYIFSKMFDMCMKWEAPRIEEMLGGGKKKTKTKGFKQAKVSLRKKGKKK